MDGHRLMDKDEPRRFQPGTLYSMLDIVAGGSITCDNCGRWQRVAGLTPESMLEMAKERGWHCRDGRDLCPICAPPTGPA